MNFEKGASRKTTIISASWIIKFQLNRVVPKDSGTIIPVIPAKNSKIVNG